MSLRWWEKADIVGRESDSSKRKMVQGLDWLRDYKEQHDQQVMQQAQENKAKLAEAYACYLGRQKRYQAADELDAYNMQLHKMGAPTIPMTCDTIEQQSQTRGQFGKQYIHEAEQVVEAAQLKELRKIAEHDAKLSVENWSQLTYAAKEAAIESQMKILSRQRGQGEAAPAPEAPEGFGAKGWLHSVGTGIAAWVSEKVGKAEDAEYWRGVQGEWQGKQQQEDWVSQGIEIPDDQGEPSGFVVTPDYKVYHESNNFTPVGSIDPETGDFIEPEPRWWEKAQNIGSWLPPHLAMTLYQKYGAPVLEKIDAPFLIQTQARDLHAKQQRGGELSEAEQHFMQTFQEEIGEPLEENKILMALHAPAEMIRQWGNVRLSPSDELKGAYYDSVGVGTRMLHGIQTPSSVAMFIAFGLGGAKAAWPKLEAAAAKGGVTGAAARTGQVALGPMYGYQHVAGQITARVSAGVLTRANQLALHGALAKLAKQQGFTLTRQVRNALIKDFRSALERYVNTEAVAYMGKYPKTMIHGETIDALTRFLQARVTPKWAAEVMMGALGKAPVTKEAIGAAANSAAQQAARNVQTGLVKVVGGASAVGTPAGVVPPMPSPTGVMPPPAAATQVPTAGKPVPITTESVATKVIRADRLTTEERMFYESHVGAVHGYINEKAWHAGAKTEEAKATWLEAQRAAPAVTPTAPVVEATATPQEGVVMGEQAGMLGVPQKVHTQKSIGKPVTASMDDYQKLQALTDKETLEEARYAARAATEELVMIQESLDADPVANYTVHVGKRKVKLDYFLKQGDWPESFTVKEAAALMQKPVESVVSRVQKAGVPTNRVDSAYVVDEIAEQFGLSEQEFIDRLMAIHRLKERASGLEPIAETWETIALAEGESFTGMPAEGYQVESIPDPSLGAYGEYATAEGWGTGRPTAEQVAGLREAAQGKNLLNDMGKMTPEYKTLIYHALGKKGLTNLTAAETALLNEVVIRLPQPKGGRPPRIPSTDEIMKEILPFDKEAVKLFAGMEDIGWLERFRPTRAVWEKLGLYQSVYSPASFTENLVHLERAQFQKELKDVQKLVRRNRRAVVFQAIENPNQAHDLTADEQKAVMWFRKYFDDWADRLELPVEMRRENYITHIFDAHTKAEIQAEHPLDMELLRALNLHAPKGVSMPYMKQRHGREMGVVQDPFRAAEAYNAAALKKLHYEPLIKRIRVFEKYLPPHAAQYLREYITSRMLGRPSETDNAMNVNLAKVAQGLEKIPKTQWLRDFLTQGNPAGAIAYHMTGMYYTAWMGFRAANAIRNLSQQTLIVADVGPENYARGVASRFTKEGKAALKESYVLQSRKVGYLPGIDRAFINHWSDQVRDKALILFKAADKENVSNAFLSGYAEAKAQGLPHDWAVKRGDEVAERTQYVYTKMGGAQWMQTAPGRVLGTMLTWPTNFIELSAHWMKGAPSRVYGDYAKSRGEPPPKARPVINKHTATFMLMAGALYAAQRRTQVRAMVYSGIISLSTIADALSGRVPGLTWIGGMANIVAGVATGDGDRIKAGWRTLDPRRTITVINQLRQIYSGDRDWLSFFVYQNYDHISDKRTEMARERRAEESLNTLRDIVAQGEYGKDWKQLTAAERETLIRQYPEAELGG